MDEKEPTTSFMKFQYCKLCRLSHKKGKKHVYCKRHQTILQNMLKKYAGKIQTAKHTLFSPQTNDTDFERGATFWCYFCETEAEKHKVSELTTVLYAGLLEHIARKEHKEAMEKFFWDNLVNKKLKPNYVLASEDIEIFKKTSFLAVKKFQRKKEQQRKMIAVNIEEMEHKRRISSQSEAGKSQLFEEEWAQVHPGSSTPLPSTSWEPDPWAQGKKTVVAYAEGLTCIMRKEDEEGDEDNVFTGGLPPWLQSSDDKKDLQGKEIGPLMSDYQKHLEREKKAKLPPGRVGAKFDHQAETSQQWLPSFGRVWSKGRRLQSKQHFQREMKQFSKKPHTSVSQEDSPVSYSAAAERLTSDWSEGPQTSNGPIGSNGSCGQNEQYNLHDWIEGRTSSNIRSDNSFRERFPAYNINNGQSNNNQVDKSINNSNSFKRPVTNELVSGYKRKRKISSTSSSSTILSGLFQTPVLYEKVNPHR